MASGAPSLPDPRKADEEEAKVEIPLDDDVETGANENTGRFAQHGTGQQPGAGAGKPPGPSVQVGALPWGVGIGEACVCVCVCVCVGVNVSVCELS
jgi:hypothetical protein